MIRARSSFAGLLTLLALSSAARATVAYAIDANGALTRFDPYSAAAPVRFGGGYSSFVSGLTIDSAGHGWAFNWTGNLYQLNLETGAPTSFGSLPPRSSGWYKDLAWDAPNNRILGLHFGSLGPTIGVVDPAAHTFTSLGPISGIPVGGHFTGLAVGPAGEIALSDQANGRVYDLTVGTGGLSAVRRTAFIPGGLLEGLEIDPASGVLLASSPISRVLPDGSLQRLRSDVSGFDIAFAPIPVPSASATLAAALLLGASRRRRWPGSNAP
jgi:hypothetical protein